MKLDRPSFVINSEERVSDYHEHCRNIAEIIARTWNGASSQLEVKDAIKLYLETVQAPKGFE